MSEVTTQIRTGRRSKDGVLEIKPFTRDLIWLSITHTGERVPPLLLTKAQAISLRNALDKLIPELEEERSAVNETYEGVERRRPAA